MTPGRQVIILDCGGGTVDLAAYQNDEEGRLVEIGLVNGAVLGSNELNQRFEDRALDHPPAHRPRQAALSS